jgi:hypothetical protein
LKCDILFSNFAFKFNLYRYTEGLLKEGKYMFVLTYLKEPLYNSQGQIPGRMDSIRRVITVQSPAKPKLVGNITLAANFSQFQADPIAFQNALIAVGLCTLNQVDP